MNAPTHIQMINGPDGKPTLVVLPYDDYLRLYVTENELIPHAVISAAVDGATPVRAWREHLKLTQVDVAARLGISQPSYAKQENSTRLRAATLARIAAALGIAETQLDF